MNDRSIQPTATSSGRAIPWWLVGVVTVMLAFALFGNRGILHIFKLKRQQADLEQQLAQIDEVNNGLRKDINTLRSDRHHLERLARSQLGMVREDEVVYQFASKPRPAAPAPPAATPAPGQ